MKIFNKKKSGYIFLIMLLSLCLFWMVRLEIKASNLKSILLEHHKSLDEGDDILDIDFLFIRKIKNRSFISLMEDNAVMQIYKTYLALLKNEIRITTDGDIKIGNEKEKYIKYDSKKDLLTLSSNFAEVSIGSIKFEGKEYPGIKMVNSQNTQKIFLLNDRLLIRSAGPNNDFFIEFNPAKEYLEIGSSSNSLVKLGKDFINIEANGDINITSKNGKVNINGQR